MDHQIQPIYSVGSWPIPKRSALLAGHWQTKSIIKSPRTNTVRVDGDFSATPFNSEESQVGAKISSAEQSEEFPASSHRRLRLATGGRDLEADAVSVRLHGKAPGARSQSRKSSRMFWLHFVSAAASIAA